MTSDNPKRKYFIQIPNLIDDMGLSVYAFRLYAHIVRRAGWDNGGDCFESKANLALACGMSGASVTRAKRELVDAGIITIRKEKNGKGTGQVKDYIRLVDIWNQNEAAYSERGSHRTPSPEGGSDTTEGGSVGTDSGSVGTKRGSVVARKNNPLLISPEENPKEEEVYIPLLLFSDSEKLFLEAVLLIFCRENQFEKPEYAARLVSLRKEYGEPLVFDALEFYHRSDLQKSQSTDTYVWHITANTLRRMEGALKKGWNRTYDFTTATDFLKLSGRYEIARQRIKAKYGEANQPVSR